MIRAFTIGCLLLLRSQNLSAESVNSLFEKVLIIGASVSNNYSTVSPAELIAKQAGVQQDNIIRRAEGWSKSSYHYTWIKERLPEINPTIIFALDLFFHDVKLDIFLTNEVKQRAKDIIGDLCKFGHQVYVGNTMPMSFFIFAPDQFNSYLHELEALYPNLHIIDVQALYSCLSKWNGCPYNIGGIHRVIRRSDALVDIVHPSPLGARMMANIVLEQIRFHNPEITPNVLPYLPLENPTLESVKARLQCLRMSYILPALPCP